MIAVIEAKHKCVWGLGKTPDEAMADAQVHIAGKKPEIRPAPADLSLANMAPGADLECCGEFMWKWVIRDQKTGNQESALQAELF